MHITYISICTYPLLMYIVHTNKNVYHWFHSTRAFPTSSLNTLIVFGFKRENDLCSGFMQNINFIFYTTSNSFRGKQNNIRIVKFELPYNSKLLVRLGERGKGDDMRETFVCHNNITF